MKICLRDRAEPREILDFNDLLFIEDEHYNDLQPTRKRAMLQFDNGYSISVITGFGAYADNEDEFEIAVMLGGGICYDTPITDDVIGHLSRDEVSSYMKQIQQLPRNN